MNEEIFIDLNKAKQHFFHCKCNMRVMCTEQGDIYRKFRATPAITKELMIQWECEYIDSIIKSWSTSSESEIVYSYYDLVLQVGHVSKGQHYGQFIPQMIEFLDTAASFDKFPRLQMAETFTRYKGWASGYSFFCSYGDYADLLKDKIDKLLDFDFPETEKRLNTAREKNRDNYDYVKSERFAYDMKIYS